MIDGLFGKIKYTHIIVEEDSLHNVIEEAVAKATGKRFSEINGRIDIIEYDKNRYLLIDKLTLSQIMVEVSTRLNIVFNVYPYTAKREVYVKFLKNTYRKGIIEEILEYASHVSGDKRSVEVYKKFKNKVKMKLLDGNKVLVYTPYNKLRLDLRSGLIEIVNRKKQCVYI